MAITAPIETDRHGIPWMRHLIPEGEMPSARVAHFAVSEDDAKWANLRSMRDPWFMRVQPGEYVKLYAGGHLQMSDTHMERRTNADVIRRAQGHVLIGGLGVGMLPAALLLTDRRDRIASLTIIEHNADVIALVEPHIRDERLTVIEGDVFSWKPPKGQRFDTIYMDIWPGITTDNLPDIARLHRRFSPYLNRDGADPLLTSWLAGYLRSEQRSERRRRYY